MSKNYEKLISLLKELFQFDRADLDFGIFRIMNQKRDEITTFLEKDLLPQVKEAFSEYQSADVIGFEEELKKTIKYAKEAGYDPEQSPKVKELRENILSYRVDVTSLENEVFSHLYSFFRRYYHEGDFLSLRRYKEGVYAIPYEGEEVKLYWANHDQYYIKSSEYLRDYAFKLPSGKQVHFKLTDADVEKDNIKAQNGKEKRFIILNENPVEEINGELFIRFEYIPDDEKRNQANLNKHAAEKVLKQKGFNQWVKELSELMPTEKNKDRTLLEKHLTDYTARNTFDYFIHKDLGGFLRRELDFYIKNEVMHLDDIENETAPMVEQYLSKIKVIRKIAGKIIAFLEQLENFQKKLWLKKKFVVETNYCVTLDRVPKELYKAIAKNDAQRKEWVKLFAIDEIEREIGTEGYSKPLSVRFLKENKFLVVDTRFFGEEFRKKLIGGFEDLDAECDGLLIHGENFQGIKFISPKYHRQVSGIYIDPPYNTDATEIVYKNGYKDSSWASLIYDRLVSSRKTLARKGMLCVTIDDCEVSNLSKIMEQALPEYELRPVIIEYNHRGRVKSNFAITHEYALWAIERGKDLITRKKEISEDIRRNLRRTGTDSTREASPKQFYGVEVDKSTLEIVGATQPLLLGENIPSHSNPKTIMVWPIDNQGIKRRWCYSRERVLEEAKEETVWAKRIIGKVQIHYYQQGKPKLRKSVWVGKKMDASTYGSELLNDLFGLGNSGFSFPKSIYAVQECLESITYDKTAVFLDYFAGSGTTAHAVINLNREDNGNRKYILVEMGDYFGVYPNLSNELVSKITTFIRKLLVSPLGEWKIKIDRIPF